MAQPATTKPNGVPEPSSTEHAQPVIPGKRKRDNGDSGDEGEELDGFEDEKPIVANGWPKGDQKKLIQSYLQVLSSFDISPSILKRPVPATDEEPHAKRQKSASPDSASTITEKVTADAYDRLEDVAADIVSMVKVSLDELKAKPQTENEEAVAQIGQFKDKAMQLLRREKAYPKTSTDPLPVEADLPPSPQQGELVLSLIGYAPQERRLFSSLPLAHEDKLTQIPLPQGMTLTHVMPTTTQERTQTLGDLFSSSRALPPLQPPKQPKTQAKGNTLDFYHPELTDTSKYQTASYSTTKLSSGYYLDYSNATPSSQIQTKQRERAQSLAGKKPSNTELEMHEMEALFRGAFSSFAPCKDDSAAVVPASVASRLWWQRAGQRHFQNMIEVEYYAGADHEDKAVEIDEDAVQEAIDAWDDSVIDPSLDDIMGTKRDEQDKEVNEILEEVSDLIETLSSYQRIRNLNLPNSQNRQSSDPVNGDMLATAGPQPCESEQSTYHVLKAQLALIIKTLPPYAVAKLNGDQLEDLLISTKVQVHTDQYKGVMEEDEAGMQARIRAQQAAQATVRPPQRTPSVSSIPYANHFQANQYGTPSRTPTMQQQPQQYFRPTATPSFPPQQRPMPPSQPRPPQPNQYSRPNGFPNQYATQLAKAQTPYGHQNMQFASQQRPQYGQMPAQGTPNARFSYQPGFPPPHQAGTPSQNTFAAYTNGQAMSQRNMSPQVQHRQPYSPSPSVQPPRYNTPNQTMGSQMNRFPSNPAGAGQNPGLTGYHTVIPEAQQQRILDQAKARVAAQERSAMFADKITQPGGVGLGGMGMTGTMDVNRLAAARASIAQQQKPQTPQRSLNGTPLGHIPHKVTPVPVPVIPGLQQRKPSS
ncbi:hypothetical protein B0J13DRAFT_560908 [Dactylonectria estremocensis]|uniref:Uncharacterized protein n=1 Tax=Dactylonectria estremocensis TaxID=1079267 RepID=A0A9P9IXK3_9HYPO|nr:hypothetical protein B0J13DRAFT_560908 [Dactylonectria estremocensis]